MTMIQDNRFDDFLLSLDDPQPMILDEFHDSITTPVLVSGLNERRETSFLSNKRQNYRLIVNLLEVKLVKQDSQALTPSSSRVFLQVKADLLGQKVKSERKTIKLSNQDTVIFNEILTFDVNTVLSQFLESNLELRLVESRNLIKSDKNIGKVDLDVASVYNDPDMRVKGRSLPILGDGPTAEVRGFIKCDLTIVTPEMIRKDGLISTFRPVTPSCKTPSSEPVDLVNSTTKCAEIRVKIFGGELPVVKSRKEKLVSRIRSRKTSGIHVSLTLGDLEGCTSSQKRLATPTWNEQITFRTLFNAERSTKLMLKISEKGSTGSFRPLSKCIDLSRISLDTNGLPIFGPSYVIVKETPKDPIFGETAAIGRLLIAIESNIIEPGMAGTLPLSVTDPSSVDLDDKKSSVGSVSSSHHEPTNFDQNGNANDHDRLDKDNLLSFVANFEPSVTVCPIDGMSIELPKEDEFTFLGVLFESNMISRKLENRKISYEVDIGQSLCNERCASPSTLDLTLGSFDDGDKSPTYDRRQLSFRSTPIKSEPETPKIETTSVLTNYSKTSEKSDGYGSPAVDTGRPSSVAAGSDTNERTNSTAPIRPDVADRDYLYLRLNEKRPLFGVEQIMVDVRKRAYESNMIRKIAEDLRIGLTDVEEMLLRSHPDTFRRLRGVLEDLIVFCNRFLALTVTPSKYPKNDLDLLFTRHRQRELIKISQLAKITMVNLSQANFVETKNMVAGYLDRIEGLAVDSQDGFPDLMIYLVADGKRVGYVRLPAADVIYSRLDDQQGPASGKLATYYVKSIKNPEVVLNRIQLYAWFGLKRLKRHSTSGLPKGYEESLELAFFQSLDGNLPRSIVYPEKHEFELRAHIFQAVLHDPSVGLWNLSVKVIFESKVLETHESEATLSPLWDVTLIARDLALFGSSETVKKTNRRVVMELYSYEGRDGNRLKIATGSAPCYLRSIEQAYKKPELAWYSLYDGNSLIGHILAGFECIQTAPYDPPHEYPVNLPEPFRSTDSGLAYRIPQPLRPTLEAYKLGVLFWGLRDIKKTGRSKLDSVKVELECSGVRISSTEIVNYKRNSNFSDPFQSEMINLPLEAYYYPPLTVKLYARVGGSSTLLGTSYISDITPFIYRLDGMNQSLKEIQVRSKIVEDLLSCMETQSSWWKRYLASCQGPRPQSCNTTRTPDFTNDFEVDGGDDDDEPEFSEPEPRPITLIDTELESSPYFRPGPGCGLQSFQLGPPETQGQYHLLDKSKVTGVFKGCIQFAPNLCPERVQNLYDRFNALPEPVTVLVRCYVVKVEDLVNSKGLEDFKWKLSLSLGVKQTPEKSLIFQNTQTVYIGKCFEVEASFPVDRKLTVSIAELTGSSTSSGKLLGETVIDLEDRSYNGNWTRCGLPRAYSPATWRDCLQPSGILENLCKLSGFLMPIISENYIEVANVKFNFEPTIVNEISYDSLKEARCLHVLHRWHEITGQTLVPEHIERRTLYHPDKSGIERGSIHLWVDIFPNNITIPEYVQIGPIPVNTNSDEGVIIDRQESDTKSEKKPIVDEDERRHEDGKSSDKNGRQSEMMMIDEQMMGEVKKDEQRNNTIAEERSKTSKPTETIHDETVSQE